jgi:hypothetical protein
VPAHPVGAGAQLVRETAAVVGGEVDRAAALAAVHRQVVGGLAAGVRRSPAAGLVAHTGSLDLDHVGAEVGQHHRAVGTRENAREVEHPEPIERWHPGII